MIRQIKRVTALACVVALVWFGGVLADSARLREDILRLHVVADSDAQEDQQVKLQVRDAIIGSLREGMEKLTSPEEAYAYVEQMLPKLTQVANQVLHDAGFSQNAQVTLGQESFPVRHYDTFSLPSGVYHSLRVTIGSGQGHNWWCVVFPQLCMGATAEAFAQTAQESQMSDGLTGALTGDYEIRFWLLDKLGELENFLWGTSE